MSHKSFLVLIVILSFIDPCKCHAQLSNLRSKLCHTWVSYEQTFHSKLLNEVVTHTTMGSEKDSLIVSEDFIVKRFYRNRTCNGFWTFSDDSIKVVFTFPDCKNFYYSMRPDEFVLETLSGDTIKMLCGRGEEGEFTERWFKIVTK